MTHKGKGNKVGVTAATGVPDDHPEDLRVWESPKEASER